MNRAAILVLIANIFNTYGDLGDVCKTDQGKDGICSSIEKCDQALQDLKRNVNPSFCGYRGNESFICCGFTSSYKTGDVSKEKCKEYTKLTKSGSGIIGGVRSRSTEFPHMVALGYGSEDDIKWNCGGSLISENFVLTAAHCLYFREEGEVKYVRAGTIKLENPEATVQNFRVNKAIPHPNYEAPVSYHDIALIKLDEPIKTTSSVKPACLQTTFQLNGSLSAIGWGHLYALGIPSNDLMKINLVEYSSFQCSVAYSRNRRTLPNGIQESLMICAGGKPNEIRDTCHGDSGGPLQITTRFHTVVGVTSFGKVCGTPNVPGVYTRVSNYIEWIENIVWA